MARCKLTNMNLRNIRKSREYQCMIIDLVKVGVVTKSAAEELLDYTIPNGLLGNAGSSSESAGSGGETGGETQGSGGNTGTTVTLLYINRGNSTWVSQEYTPESTDPATESSRIITAARAAFGDDTINDFSFVELNPEYVEGTGLPFTKYPLLDPQPTELTNGALIVCAHNQSKDDESDDESGGLN